jgi:hypothetical protein
VRVLKVFVSRKIFCDFCDFCVRLKKLKVYERQEILGGGGEGDSSRADSSTHSCYNNIVYGIWTDVKVS